MNKDKEETMNSIYKLVCKFTYSHKGTIDNIGIENIDDFINNAYIFYLEYCYPSYDSSKGEISTHIYSVLEKNLTNIIYATKYNISVYSVKNALHCRRDDVKSNFYKIYNSDSIDNYYDEDDEDNVKKHIDLQIETDENNIATFEDCDFDKYVKEQLNKCINKYISKRKDKVNAEKTKNILLFYFFNKFGNKKVTFQSIADNYGVTKQCIEQMISRFNRFARKDNTFRKIFNK